MSITPDIRKVTTLTERIPAEVRKPLFAAVGAADLAIEQVKEVPAGLTAEAKKVQSLLTLGARQVPGAVKTVPTQVLTQIQGLRGEVETRVVKVTTTATETYGGLAVRGKRLVGQIRRQPATEAAIAEGKEAVRKAEAAALAAKKSVKAGEKAVEGAAGKIG